MSSLIFDLLQDSDKPLNRPDDSVIIADTLPICFPAAAFLSAHHSSSSDARAFQGESAYDLEERLRWQDITLPEHSSGEAQMKATSMPSRFFW